MRFAPLVAALAAFFAISSASATTVLIDGFDYQPFTISSPNTIGPTTTTGLAPLSGPLAGIAIDRTVTLSTTRIGNGPSPSATVDVTDPTTTVYSYSSGAGWNGTSTISWTIPVNSFVPGSGPVSLYFDTVISNSGNPFTPDSNKVVFSGSALGGVAINSFLPVTGGLTQYALNSAQVTSLLAGGTLTATFSGLPAYDITIDNFGLALPEPTSLALVGLALVGAGIATRRRGA
jgi:hypothetical protein